MTQAHSVESNEHRSQFPTSISQSMGQSWWPIKTDYWLKWPIERECKYQDH